jgi:hypothetical protein
LTNLNLFLCCLLHIIRQIVEPKQFDRHADELKNVTHSASDNHHSPNEIG